MQGNRGRWEGRGPRSSSRRRQESLQGYRTSIESAASSAGGSRHLSLSQQDWLLRQRLGAPPTSSFSTPPPKRVPVLRSPRSTRVTLARSSGAFRGGRGWGGMGGRGSGGARGSRCVAGRRARARALAPARSRGPASLQRISELRHSGGPRAGGELVGVVGLTGAAAATPGRGDAEAPGVRGLRPGQSRLRTEVTRWRGRRSSWGPRRGCGGPLGAEDAGPPGMLAGGGRRFHRGRRKNKQKPQPNRSLPPEG